MQTKPAGLWAPLITPFKDGAVDYASYERLIDHFVACGVDGLFPLGTTGESPTLDEAEIEQLVERTVARAGTVPVFVGVSVSPRTRRPALALERLASPASCRFARTTIAPAEGADPHFRASAATVRRVIYNILSHGGESPTTRW